MSNGAPSSPSGIESGDISDYSNSRYSSHELMSCSFESGNRSGPTQAFRSQFNHKQAIIILHDGWGLKEYIKCWAYQTFAKDFVLLLPDLYRGAISRDREEVIKLVWALDWDESVDKDVRGSVEYLLSNGVEKVGVMGFSLGGAFSIASSVLIPNIQAVVSWYGIAPKQRPIADHRKALIPMQFHFGIKDIDPNSESQSAMESDLIHAKIPHEIYRYDTGHAFLDITRPHLYVPEAAILASNRTIAFFKKHLV